ncbi:LacI family DNA-binding transcriptional regulator [Amycolatopsis sp. lyj-346]|uniref:LacI family DNA-binding transcriptional regulator n=1 Tax=Amycolatopsis sp. lyj-346 TaxID=2789289 RepID=UPI00397A3671
MTRSGRSGGTSAPSSKDVALAAGVSQKTVSRVFNNEQYVSADVRRRVLAAAEEIGYRPNNAARALASGRTRSIGIVTLGTALYGPASLLAGIERAVRNSGYALRVVSTLEGDPSGVAGAVESLLEQGVDGIVVSEPIDEGPLSLRVDVPVLVFGSAPVPAAPRIITAGVISEALARLATDHLLDLGHETVHHIAGPRPWYAARDRTEGWRKALRARGAPAPPVVDGDWSARSGYAAGRVLADDDVTAVFAANDDMAIGLIRALLDAGKRVPEDVSVVGYDDTPISAYVTPPLTTVRQPFDAMASTGLRLLVHAIEQPQAGALDPGEPPLELVVRASTAPPRSRTALGAAGAVKQ